MNENTNNRGETNKSETKHVWVIYFVGFEDTGDDEESTVEPYVGRERIETTEDADQMADDAALAALVRGGRVVALVGDDEADAERTRVAIELEIMRYR
jgi:hypothetical protein